MAITIQSTKINIAELILQFRRFIGQKKSIGSMDKRSKIKLTITDEQRHRTADILELSVEDAETLIGEKTLNWCLLHRGKASPLIFDSFHKVIVSYKIDNIPSNG